MSSKSEMRLTSQLSDAWGQIWPSDGRVLVFFYPCPVVLVLDKKGRINYLSQELVLVGLGGLHMSSLWASGPVTNPTFTYWAGLQFYCFLPEIGYININIIIIIIISQYKIYSRLLIPEFAYYFLCYLVIMNGMYTTGM
jgi:hypothetical protein